MIDQQVLQYIKAKKLFTERDKILVAVSGGADSVALLRILHAARFRCEAAHCNFHLRGAESDRDEEFVRSLCKQCGIALHTAHFDTSRYAAEKHLSIEMAARELRYRWFEDMRQTCGAKVVAVAHHRDDSVETMLLNLVRGTGIAGLQGIRPVNGTVVRPLLCVGRNEICAYLDSIGQPYVTDSTNLENKYTRNKIRNCLLPLMEEVNPSVKACLAETGNRMGEIAAIYEESIAEAKKRVSTPQGIDIGKLLEETAPRTVLFEMLHPLGFNSAQVRNVFESLTGQPGKQFHSNDWRAVKDRGMLLLMSKNVKVDTPSFRLEKEELVLLTSRDSRIAKRIPSGTPIDILEARDETFICSKPGHSVRATQDALFASRNMHPRILMETISIEVGKRSAIAWVAVSVTASRAAATPAKVSRTFRATSSARSDGFSLG